MGLRIFATLIFILTACSLSGQNIEKDYPKYISLKVGNPVPLDRLNTLVKISANEVRKAASDFNSEAFIVMVNGVEIPSQFLGSREPNGSVAFVIEKMAGKQVLTVNIRYAPAGKLERDYPKRTQAELSYKAGGKFVNREYIGGSFRNADYLRVPPEHKDHSWFIRYEGPGWESDKVGYRLYLDQRNAIDVFGKRVPEMILQNVGKDGFDSYHELQPWGMDVMKVGKSLGLGSIGHYSNGTVTRVEETDSVTCRITENGNVFSSVDVTYFGWKAGPLVTTVESQLSIHAGSPITHYQLKTDGDADGLCTGIVKDANAEVEKSEGDQNAYGYVLTFGKQSLNNDNLGLALFFPSHSFKGFTEDEFSYIVKLAPRNRLTDYYFMATWENGIDGKVGKKEFHEYVRKVSSLLAQPVTVSVITK